MMHRLLTAPRSGARCWQVMRGVQAVWLTGGAAPFLRPDVIARLIGIPVIADARGAFVAESGGYAILQGRRGMVCDLGQSALKISWQGRRWRVPRDPARLPHGLKNPPPEILLEQRQALRAFFGGAVQQAISEAAAGLPECVVVALPCWLDSGIVLPLGSSYAGLTQDASFVAETLNTAGLPNARALVLNDAELAGVSAVEDHRIMELDRVLVLTAGHAYGAAVVDVPRALLRRLAGWPMPVRSRMVA